jgi:hypothetical protein
VNGREVDTSIMVDCTGWRHDEDDVEIAGHALDEKCRVIVATIVTWMEADAIYTRLVEVQPTNAAHAKVKNKEGSEAALGLNLIGQIPAPINDTGFEKRFHPNDSLMVVLHHEIALHNGVIVFMNQSLKETLADLKGTIIIDDTLEKIVKPVVGNRVSEAWRSLTCPFVFILRAFICGLGMYVKFMDAWIKQRLPVRFIIRPFFHPEQFLIAVLQSNARKNGASFDTLSRSQHQNSRLNRMA